MDRFYRRSPHAASRIVDGEAVIVKFPESEFLILNQSGSAVWQRTEGALTGEQIREAVAREFGVADPQGVGEFLEELTRRGLMEASETPFDRREDSCSLQEFKTTGPYSVPKILEEEVVQSIAGFCASFHTGGGGDCRTFGACAEPWDP